MNEETVTSNNFYGGQENLKIFFEVDKCPVCHQHQKPLRLLHRHSKGLNGELYFEALQCTNNKCQYLFLAIYLKRTFPDSPHYGKYTLLRLAPWRHEEKEFPSEIKSISLGFCSIYNEAFKAENDGLKQICGPGYRKALEFLIKDYCIHKNPDERSNIESILLVPVIKKYIKDPDILEMAELAAWLGNDETHYFKKWPDKDLQDCKNLVELTVHYITAELKKEAYKANMKGPPTAQVSQPGQATQPVPNP